MTTKGSPEASLGFIGVFENCADTNEQWADATFGRYKNRHKICEITLRVITQRHSIFPSS
jgi:hypothetical protein